MRNTDSFQKPQQVYIQTKKALIKCTRLEIATNVVGTFNSDLQRMKRFILFHGIVSVDIELVE